MRQGRNPLPRPHPVGHRLRGAGLRFPVARGTPHPPGGAAVVRAAGRGRRRAVRPALPEPTLPQQRLGHPKGPGSESIRAGAAAGFLASLSHKGLRRTKGDMWAPRAANSALTPHASTLQKSGENQPDLGRECEDWTPCPHRGPPHLLSVHHLLGGP